VAAHAAGIAPLSVDAEEAEDTSLDGISDNPSADSDRLLISVQAFQSAPRVQGTQFESPDNQAKVTSVVAALNVIQVEHVSNGRQGSEEGPGLESPLCCSVSSDRCTPGSIMVPVTIVQCDNDNSALAVEFSRGGKNTHLRSNKAVGDGKLPLEPELDLAVESPRGEKNTQLRSNKAVGDGGFQLEPDSHVVSPANQAHVTSTAYIPPHLR
jgi:hypothetical protein